MATVYITFEIAKDFEEWKEVFNDDQDNLNENGIETLAVGLFQNVTHGPRAT